MMALVPSDSETTVEEKLTESLRFIDFFRRTYVPQGKESPPFYEGLLADASCSAWNAPAAKIKMLAMYFHHDANPHSTEIASHLLAHEVLESIAMYLLPSTGDYIRTSIQDGSDVIQVMREYCVLWGWDVSSPHNWHLICEMVADNFGNATGELCQELEESHFPCIILLSRGKEGIELVQVVPLFSSKFNTLFSLYSAVDLFEGKIKPDLIHKETSKKQKSLFCGGSWTKVTNAMAINASMATYRFTSSSSNVECSKAQEEVYDSEYGRDQDKFDIDLKEILKVRQVHEKDLASRTSQICVVGSAKTKNERMAALFELMRDELATRKSKVLVDEGLNKVP